MYAVETTVDDTTNEPLHRLAANPTLWQMRKVEQSHADACRIALKIRDAGRHTDGKRPVVRVRGMSGDDKGKTTLIMQRLAYRN